MSWTHLGDTNIKKTRKPHKCWGCCDEIPVGSPCRKRTGAFDGYGVDSFYCCEKCEQIENLLGDKELFEIGEDGFEYGWVNEVMACDGIETRSKDDYIEFLKQKNGQVQEDTATM